MSEGIQSSRARLGLWILFVLLSFALVAYCVYLTRRSPRPVLDAQATADGRRFSLTLTERQKLYTQIAIGEEADRILGAAVVEGKDWNRNSDDKFHEAEWGRLRGLSRTTGKPMWLLFMVIDEGMRARWPLPPQTHVYIDDAPLGTYTKPYKLRELPAR